MAESIIKSFRFAFALAIATLLVVTEASIVQAVEIVALGASNTYGKGVSRSEGYPAHLQRMLRAKGIHATVRNAGINGNTTGQMLARLESTVRPGTEIVILQPGGNDRRKGIGRATRQSNIRTIRQRLRAKGIKVIMLPNRRLGQARRSSPAYDQGDGSHLTSQGYRAIAASLLPQVLNAID